ncbi:MAG: bifunctional tetrahydrofolate synthase/dihydrofolate synthase [Burkholderiales bacterium]|nr:bifunctional tetrahydrofolate synthase/dihydrofolate synthase [Burkholderiales bacterium]
MKTVEEWLDYNFRLHHLHIDMGLERMRQMVQRMDIKFDCPLIIVGGTNGKGSVCAYLEKTFITAGYKTALHTSPHLLRINERARINGKQISDSELIRNFEKVDAVRGDLTPSYFEYSLLAFLSWFQEEKPDIVILEVGLGGRLDAVNVFDPDVSIITSIGIDHVAYLGDTREKIGWDKAHIFRPGRPAICGDPNPPVTVIEYAKEIGAELKIAGRDFTEQVDGNTWSFLSDIRELRDLPLPAMKGEFQLRNAAAAIAALENISSKLPVPKEDIVTALETVQLPGRFQKISNCPDIITDVGHNPHAAVELAKTLKSEPFTGKTLAVFGMLADKDRAKVCRLLGDCADRWYVADLATDRGGSASTLGELLNFAGVSNEQIRLFPTVEDALQAAKNDAAETDRIIAFGSFLTVAAVLKFLEIPVG